MVRSELRPLGGARHGTIRLDPDRGRNVPDQSPRVVLLKREVIGRDEDGNRVFDWVVFDEAIAQTQESREVTTDGLTMLTVRLTGLAVAAV